jgi:serine/threonine-protein kinase
MLEEGTVLGGKYRIEHKIATGGMGLVFEATHLKLGVKVALKFLREEYVKEQKIVDRFVREAQAVAQLRSQHICRVSDVEATEAGVPYIVMELLQGRDLQMVLKTAPLDPATTASYVLQACLAIAEAHSIGIVHRDLKPANLYLTYGSNGAPLIKVLDFGVAKAAPKQNDHGMTQTQSVMGSPGYMSPEQLRSSRTVDARTDIWSLGIVLYELVVGKRPWAADTITELTLKVANDPMPAMPAGIPKAFVDVVERCLSKTVEGRYQNIAELANALGPLAPDGPDLARGVERVLGVTATIVDIHTGPVAAIARDPQTSSPPTTLTTASGVVDSRVLRRRPALKVLALGAGVLIVALVALKLVGTHDSDATSPQAAAPAPVASPPPPIPPAPPPAIAVDAAVAEAPPDAAVETPATASVPVPSKSAGKPKSKPVPKPPPKKKRPTIEDVRDSRI